MTTLVFLETTADVGRYVEVQRDSRLSNARLIALSPWAAYALERAGLESSSPDRYVDQGERERIGDTNRLHTERIVELLDSAIAASLADRATTPRPAFAEFQRVKILMDAATLRVRELRAIIAAEKPDLVLHLPMVDRAPTPQSFDFMAEPLYSRLLPRVAADAGVSVESIGDSRWLFDAARPPRRLTRRRIAKNLAAIAWPAFAGIGLGTRALTVLALDSCLSDSLARSKRHRLILWRAGTPRALSVGGLPRLLNASVDGPGPPADAFDRAWLQLQQSQELASVLVQDGIPIDDLIFPKLKFMVLDIAPVLLRLERTASVLLRRWGVDVVLAYSFADGPERMVAHAARDTGIPVVAYDHGAVGYFVFPPERYLDAAAADSRLVWGEGVRAQALERYPGTAEPIPVGSAMLDALITKRAARRKRDRDRLRQALGIDQGQTVVLYCATSLTSNMQYAGHLIIPDTAYVSNQFRIVRFLARFPAIRVVVKLHPSPVYPQSPVVDLIRDESLSTCRVVVERPLSEMLDVADLFVNDSPTTTFLQMLTTATPILVYKNSAIELEPAATGALRRAAFVTDSLDELENELTRRLQSGDLSGGLTPDSTFVRSFGTHLNDGRSSERAVATLDRLIRKDVGRPDRVAMVDA